MKKRKHKGGIEAIKQRYGYWFVAPWLFGIAVFVLKPLATSLQFAFSDVSFAGNGVETGFQGLKWFRYLLAEDPDYIDRALASLASILTSLPIILSLSLVLSLILNQKFKGRMLARSIFFLPVIISSGPVMSVLATFSMSENLSASFAASDTVQSVYMEVIDFQEILMRLNLPDSINSLMTGYLSDTFNLIWSCGIQILLFVAGLQSIPEQLYEVGRVEGASAWEKFWYITVPMMGRTILLVAFYTMVQQFGTGSQLVDSATTLLRKQVYDRSSAMLWLYFLCVGLVMAAILWLYRKLCLNRWES